MCSNISEGATTALLKFGETKIKQLAEYFRTKRVKFIGDSETIKIAKEVRDSGELIFYKAYIKDKNLLFNIKLGLILRKVENDYEKLQNLKEKVKSKYQIEGLHIAYFVQNGLLNRYVGILLDNLDSAETLNKIITKTLNDLDKHVVFVNSRYKSRDIIQEAMILAAQNPNILIISGAGSTRKEVVNSESQLKGFLKNYELEKISSEKKEILFFKYLI